MISMELVNKIDYKEEWTHFKTQFSSILLEFINFKSYVFQQKIALSQNTLVKKNQNLT